MRPQSYSLLFLSCVVWTLAGCSDDDGDPTRPVARFSLDPGDAFFTQPFPCDLRRTSPVGIDLTGFPEGEVLVNKMVDAAATHSEGFAVGGVIFLITYFII